MLKNKKLIQFIVSLVALFLFINYYLKGKEQSMEGQYGTVQVLAAARDVPPHTQLQQGDLMTKQVPLKYLEPGAYMVKIPGQAEGMVQGKVTIASIAAGAQITQANLVDPSPNKTGVGPLLPPGKRGYLLRLGNTDVAELLLPGDHVDIMATFTIRGKNNDNSKATYTILQDILVIAVGKELRPPHQDVSGKKEGSEALMLTLALSPTEAERLALAQSESQGEITVIVRPQGEGGQRPIPGVTPDKLLN
jgi:Flp pilus assembly protein CpaB